MEFSESKFTSSQVSPSTCIFIHKYLCMKQNTAALALSHAPKSLSLRMRPLLEPGVHQFCCYKNNQMAFIQLSWAMGTVPFLANENLPTASLSIAAFHTSGYSHQAEQDEGISAAPWLGAPVRLQCGDTVSSDTPHVPQCLPGGPHLTHRAKRNSRAQAAASPHAPK